MAPASHCTFVNGNFKDSKYPRWMVVVQTNPHLGQHGFASFQGPANGQKVCDELIKEFWFISDTCNKIADSTFSPKKVTCVIWEVFHSESPEALSRCRLLFLMAPGVDAISSADCWVWNLSKRWVSRRTLGLDGFGSVDRGWRLDSWNLLQRTWC